MPAERDEMKYAVERVALYHLFYFFIGTLLMTPFAWNSICEWVAPAAKLGILGSGEATIEHLICFVGFLFYFGLSVMLCEAVANDNWIAMRLWVLFHFIAFFLIARFDQLNGFQILLACWEVYCLLTVDRYAEFLCRKPKNKTSTKPKVPVGKAPKNAVEEDKIPAPGKFNV